jgi:hypothetical protein
VPSAGPLTLRQVDPAGGLLVDPVAVEEMWRQPPYPLTRGADAGAMVAKAIDDVDGPGLVDPADSTDDVIEASMVPVASTPNTAQAAKAAATAAAREGRAAVQARDLVAEQRARHARGAATGVGRRGDRVHAGAAARRQRARQRRGVRVHVTYASGRVHVPRVLRGRGRRPGRTC